MQFDPAAARAFAVHIVQQLRAAGHEALWAGGCVRDQLLGKTPKDYDVATSARPEEVRDLFGRKRTIPVGASFGVITVVGPRSAGNIEVATFRRDAGYSDGRRPDAVAFSSAEEDAQRRDFTINGLFFDPLVEQVIDYVGGERDLNSQLLRAIGDPRQRFTEDKLRMLRAVRFTATLGFTLDPLTAAAIGEQAHELVIVSAERIAAELRRMLRDPRRGYAFSLLYQTSLLPVILPEARVCSPESDEPPNTRRGELWEETLAILQQMNAASFPMALAALLRRLPTDEKNIAEVVGGRWKLSRDEIARTAWLLQQETLLRQAAQVFWPQLQRVLIQPGVQELVDYTRAVAAVVDGTARDVDFAQSRLLLPKEELNPLPLITGDDLRRAGLLPGPRFRVILEAVRDAQLMREIATFDEALGKARSLAQSVS